MEKNSRNKSNSLPNGDQASGHRYTLVMGWWSLEDISITQSLLGHILASSEGSIGSH